jgi:hypothetical protein
VIGTASMASIAAHCSRFWDHPEIAPDNNSSERAPRHTAAYRKVTGGFRSAWCADLYATVRSTVLFIRGGAARIVMLSSTGSHC